MKHSPRSTSKWHKKWKHFQIAQKSADQKLICLDNVVGTAFGLKSINGTLTKDVCLTVFVTQKVANGALKSNQKIPPKVRRFGFDLPTDVVSIGQLRLEAGFAISDGAKLGTNSCFAFNGADIFGLSCAHCIAGIDNDISTPNIITMEFPMQGNYVNAGSETMGYRNLGTGVFPDFGDFDGGIFQINPLAVQLRQYLSTRTPLPCFRPPRPGMSAAELFGILQYTPVESWGAGTSNIIRGQVRYLFVSLPPSRYDVVIANPAGGPISTQGDSGMIWKTPLGEALAIHIAGDAAGPNNTSMNSFCSFAFRLEDRFGLRLLNA